MNDKDPYSTPDRAIGHLGTPEDYRLATEQFNSIVDELLKAHAEVADVVEESEFAMATLYLRTEGEGGATVLITIGAEKFHTSDSLMRDIRVVTQRIDELGERSDVEVTYSTTNTVHDGMLMKREVNTTGQTRAYAGLRGEAFLAFLDNEAQNWELAKTMGVDKEPVGSDEMGQLAKLLGQAEVDDVS